MKIHFRLSDERLITPTGISLVGQLLATSNFIRIINRLPMEKKRSQPQIPTGDILLCYIALLCQAKTCFDAYRELEADREFYKLGLGLKKGIASPETARQRMDYLAENASVHTAVLDACVTMFEEMGIQPSPEEHGFVPIDADVSCMDNSNTCKENVSRTYAGYDGYAPIFAYIGTEGFLLDAELREGKQHSQKHTPEFLCELLHYGHKIMILLTTTVFCLRTVHGSSSREIHVPNPKKNGQNTSKSGAKIRRLPVKGKQCISAQHGRM